MKFNTQVLARIKHLGADLSPKQKKLDIDGDGVIDADDLKEVRKGKLADKSESSLKDDKANLAKVKKVVKWPRGTDLTLLDYKGKQWQLTLYGKESPSKTPDTDAIKELTQALGTKLKRLKDDSGYDAYSFVLNGCTFKAYADEDGVLALTVLNA